MKWWKERDAYVLIGCKEHIYISEWSNSNGKLYEYESSVVKFETIQIDNQRNAPSYRREVTSTLHDFHSYSMNSF